MNNKKICIISSTFRKNGNSELLAKEFERGALENGNETKFISLRDITLEYCKGCLGCQNNGKCIIKDDVNDILDDISESDVLVFSTPIYYYSISGQLKTFLDRLNPLYSRNNKFREVYLLASCADTENSAIDGAKVAIEGWTSCFSDVFLSEILLAKDVNLVGDIKKFTSNEENYLKMAYELGKKA